MSVSPDTQIFRNISKILPTETSLNYDDRKVRRTRKLLPEVPHLGDLVLDLYKPWQPCDISAARGKEWERAFEGRTRKVGLVGSGKEKLPWGLTKLPPWTRALVARYFLGSFPSLKGGRM